MTERRVIWQEATLICDFCGMESESFLVGPELVGKKCKWCGTDSLLTQEQYDEYYLPMKKVADKINRWFGWIPFLTCTYEESKQKPSVEMKFKEKK